MVHRLSCLRGQPASSQYYHDRLMSNSRPASTTGLSEAPYIRISIRNFIRICECQGLGEAGLDDDGPSSTEVLSNSWTTVIVVFWFSSSSIPSLPSVTSGSSCRGARALSSLSLAETLFDIDTNKLPLFEQSERGVMPVCHRSWPLWEPRLRILPHVVIIQWVKWKDRSTASEKHAQGMPTLCRRHAML